MARESKFQNLTVDFRQLRTLNMNDRMDFLRSREGSSILPSFTPSQLNDLFPWFYRRSFTDIGQAFKSVSDRRNISGGVSAEAAEPVSTTGMYPRAARDAAAAGAIPRRETVSPTWQNRLQERTGVNVNEPAGGPAMERLKREISRGEGNYDSVNRGRAGDSPGGASRLLGRPLSDFTVGEIMDMQRGGAGQRQLFAVGKYQFIPNTLSEAVRWTGMDRNTKFDSAAQERLFDYTISEQKRPALAAYLSGRSNDRNAALRDLSLEYASIPGPGGRGAYDRDRAGNMAHGGMQRAESMLQMLSEAREERITGQTSQPEASVEAPQLPNGLVPKLLEELNRMTPRQQQKFMTALDKIGGVEKMNELYQQSPSIIDRAAAQGSNFSYSNVAFSDDNIRSGVSRMSADAQATLQRLDSLGVPVTVTSTFRSPERNASTAGSSRTSLHMAGNALDIRTRDKSPEELARTVQALKRAGFNKVLIENDHLHVEYHPGSNDFNVGVRRGHANPNITLEQAQAATTNVQFREQMQTASTETATPTQSIPQTLQTPSAPAGAPRQQVEQPQEVVQPSTDTLPSLRVMATGGHMRTDAKQLQAYGLDKGKLQRENMLVTDGSNPLFTMNSEEEMKFNPNTGKVSVNPSARGLKADPEALKETIQSPVDATRTTNTVREERATEAVMPQPTMVSSSPSATPTNSYDTILNKTIDKMSPSFERAIARSRFANTGDAALGGHFDFGASNMA